jgi:4a-hydroxytetrahydrobiopterin dehydratase
MENEQSAERLAARHCIPCDKGTPPLSEAAADDLLRQLDGWERQGPLIHKTFRFKNFHQTMAFVNAVAWIAHRQGHHPDLEVGYAVCQVRYSTHAINGLSANDFICAAQVDALWRQ